MRLPINLEGLSSAARWWRWLRRSAILSLTLAAALAQRAGEGTAGKPETSELRHARLHIVVSGRIFASLNRNDAVASVKGWFDIVAKSRGFLLDSKVEVLDNTAEIRQRLEVRSADALILDFVDYLRLESSGLVVPDLVAVRGSAGVPLHSYVLLVNESSGAKSIADLVGKRLLSHPLSGSNAGLAWVDVLLGRQSLGRAALFFAQIKDTRKAQGCVLPLFFGAADACVVDEVNLEMLKEMNPQLRSLRVLARSSPVLEYVVATPLQPHPFRKELLDATLSLHLDPRGTQLLMMFKSARLIRARPADIAAAKAFWTEYFRLTGAPAASAAGATPLSSGVTTLALVNVNGRGAERRTEPNTELSGELGKERH